MKMNYSKFCVLIFICSLTGLGCKTRATMEPSQEKTKASPADPITEVDAMYQTALSNSWNVAFSDSCTNDWQELWFLDGKNAALVNDQDGLSITAGPTFGNHADHSVIWTKDSFEGDLKIEYDYTRLDDAIWCVNILYIQATGEEEGPYTKDILEWKTLRDEPYMSSYFKRMNTLHISYAAFMYSKKDATDPEQDYVRARRYLPATDGLDGTELYPDSYERTGLFKKDVLHHITVIKKDGMLFMEVENSEETRLFHWDLSTQPEITEGRIGLRHMFTRAARYKNFTISTLDSK